MGYILHLAARLLSSLGIQRAIEQIQLALEVGTAGAFCIWKRGKNTII